MSETAAIALLAKLAKAALKYACETDEKDRAQWLGKWDVADWGNGLWRVKSDSRDPLRLRVHSRGLEYAGLDPKGVEFITDGGSVPKLAQKIKKLHLRPDDFMRSYSLHDAAYKSACVWVRDPAKSQAWTRIPVNRADADMLLFLGLTCDETPSGENASIADCAAIYRAVQMFAGGAWDKHRSDRRK